MQVNSKVRHILKAISWRVFGSADTFLLSFLLTKDFSIGLKITSFEFLTKTILYYFHERAWYNIKFFKTIPSKIRHLLKTITWRFLASIDTILIGYFISGKIEIGVFLGGLELVTKMVLYYLHERFWYRIKFGLKKN